MEVGLCEALDFSSMIVKLCKPALPVTCVTWPRPALAVTCVT